MSTNLLETKTELEQKTLEGFLFPQGKVFNDNPEEIEDFLNFCKKQDKTEHSLISKLEYQDLWIEFEKDFVFPLAI